MKMRVKSDGGIASHWVRMMAAVGLLMLAATAVDGREMHPDAIIGTWVIEKDGQPSHHIEVSRCGDHYCGRIVWLSDPDHEGRPKRDEKNPDASLRDRPLLNLKVLWGYSHQGGDVWSGGELYAFEKGRTVSPELVMIDENQLRLQVKFLFFKKSFTWKRLIPDE